MCYWDFYKQLPVRVLPAAVDLVCFILTSLAIMYIVPHHPLTITSNVAWKMRNTASSAPSTITKHGALTHLTCPMSLTYRVTLEVTSMTLIYSETRASISTIHLILNSLKQRKASMWSQLSITIWIIRIGTWTKSPRCKTSSPSITMTTKTNTSNPWRLSRAARQLHTYE